MGILKSGFSTAICYFSKHAKFQCLYERTQFKINIQTLFLIDVIAEGVY